ncbi:restriction endonuclease subunit S [Gluconobacter cerinus]|uniref:restriction endonuclease subunit S n=1 Tax=Gluconobacter cerinus TaxID=38307 RepID=UPI00193F993A|nr:restriction endonuclease subunit S [Gluconobacter cerinus]MBM3097136.1 restriction endonuclease subunit S [Gluconobacter cerinus]
MSFPQYPRYKSTANLWCAAIPDHWDTWKISHAFGAIGSGTTPPSDEPKWYEDGTIPWVTTGELRENTIHETVKAVTCEALEKFSALRIYPAGSLAIAMYGATIGRLGILGVDAATNQACCVMSDPQALAVKFVFYWLQAFKKQLVDWYATGGGQPNVNQQIVASLRISAPSIAEQTAIAAFLDRETGKIDALIAEQEKLLTLLAEKRQATISHAVTRGLNPNAPMKDSGIAWLGEVPEHWEVSTLKYHWTVSDCKHITADFVEDGFPLASIREVQGQYVSLKDAKKTTLYFYNLLIEGGRKPVAGDLIFSRNATVGEVAQVTEEHPKFAMGQDVCLLKKIENDNSSDYFQLVIRSSVVEKQIKSIMIGSTFKRINVEDIRSLVIPVPSVREQKTIAAFVQRENDKFNSLIDQICTQIGFLKERRTALIAAAVTGKIDVRNTVSEVQAS